MSFPRYPQYARSQYYWLGEIPSHWSAVKLRYLTMCLDGRRVPLNSSERAERQGEIPYWGANCIVDYLDQALFDEDLVLLGEDGAPFFETTRPVAFYSSGRIWPNNHVHVLRPRIRGSGQFIAYALNATDYAPFIEGSTRDKLTQSAMNSIPLPWPPELEREVIVSVLDRETAKIDALIAEQQRLMELLQEKRQAVISHAVTKGLNPDVPMKPSGVEWIGNVPAHWDVMQVRRILRRIEQGWSPECYSRAADPEEWGIVRSGCVNHGVFDPQQNKVLPEALSPRAEYEIRSGDLLMSRASGSPEIVGSVAYVSTTRPRLMLSDKIFRLHTASHAEPTFVGLMFAATHMRSQIERAISGAEGLANNLPQSSLRSFMCVMPPPSEQRDIVAWVFSATKALDDLSTDAARAVALLQERRSAVISAAVTGKFQVDAV